MFSAVHSRGGSTHTFFFSFLPFPRFFCGLDVQYMYRLGYPYRLLRRTFPTELFCRCFCFCFGRFPTDCRVAVFQPRRGRPLPGSRDRRDRSRPRTRLWGVVRLPRDPCVAHHSRRRPRAGEMGGMFALQESFLSLCCDNGLDFLATSSCENNNSKNSR